MLINTDRFSHHINQVCATEGYQQLLNNITARLSSLPPTTITDITYNGNHLAFNQNRFVGYLNNITVHHFKARLDDPMIAMFYLQGNGISYSHADIMLAELSNLINRTFSNLRIIEVTSIAHQLLDGIVDFYLSERVERKVS